eukprot:1610538-Amphidinium_carterae.1
MVLGSVDFGVGNSNSGARGVNGHQHVEQRVSDSQSHGSQKQPLVSTASHCCNGKYLSTWFASVKPFHLCDLAVNPVDMHFKA